MMEPRHLEEASAAAAVGPENVEQHDQGIRRDAGFVKLPQGVLSRDFFYLGRGSPPRKNRAIWDHYGLLRAQPQQGLFGVVSPLGCPGSFG